jgi:predicted membrane channel-forming protein YqfA (hemolysin III family)
LCEGVGFSPDSNEDHAISHLIGAFLSISALAVLVTLAAIDYKSTCIIGFAIYGTSLFPFFLSRCLLHFLFALWEIPARLRHPGSYDLKLTSLLAPRIEVHGCIPREK